MNAWFSFKNMSKFSDSGEILAHFLQIIFDAARKNHYVDVITICSISSERFPISRYYKTKSLMEHHTKQGKSIKISLGKLEWICFNLFVTHHCVFMNYMLNLRQDISLYRLEGGKAIYVLVWFWQTLLRIRMAD